MFDGLDDVLDVIEESFAESLDAGNRTELDQAQQDIIAIQEGRPRPPQSGAVSRDGLRDQSRLLQLADGRSAGTAAGAQSDSRTLADMKYWMDAFREYIHSGEKLDTADAIMLRQPTNRTMVYDARLEILLRIGVALEQAHAH